MKSQHDNGPDMSAVSGQYRYGGVFGSIMPLILLAALVVVIVLWQTASMTRERAMVRMVAQGQQQLDLHTANLRGQLGKYEHLPELLAANR